MPDAQVVALLTLAVMVVFGLNQWRRRKPRTRELIGTRYLVVRSVERLPRLVAGEIDSIPLGNRQGLLSRQGPGYDLWAELAAAGLGRQGTPWDEVVLGRGTHIADYLAENPDIPTPSYDGYEGYSTQRGTREADLAIPGIADHPLVRFLLEIGVPRSELGQIVTYPEPHCEGTGYSLRFLPREVWLVMLVIEPLSKHGVVVERVTGHLRSADGRLTGDRTDVQFPPVMTREGEALLLPLGALLPPYEVEIESLDLHWQDDAQWDEHALWDDDSHWDGIVEPGLFQSVDHVRVDADRDTFSVVGAILEPEKLTFKAGRRRRSLHIHSLDPSNMLALDTMWITGTCPHLFERNPNGTLAHIRELLPHGHLGLVEDHHVPAQGCNELVVAELEFEVTYLEVVEQGGEVLAADVTLRRGDTLTLALRGGTPVRFLGRYYEEEEPLKPGGSRFKVAIVGDFLARDTNRRRGAEQPTRRQLDLMGERG
jgi:hypothetical protein